MNSILDVIRPPPSFHPPSGPPAPAEVHRHLRQGLPRYSPSPFPRYAQYNISENQAVRAKPSSTYTNERHVTLTTVPTYGMDVCGCHYTVGQTRLGPNSAYKSASHSRARMVLKATESSKENQAPHTVYPPRWSLITISSQYTSKQDDKSTSSGILTPVPTALQVKESDPSWAYSTLTARVEVLDSLDPFP